MIRVVIIEDEVPSRNKIKRFLEGLEESVEVIAELDSVEAGISFFKNSPKLELLISDIELLDGNVFQLFEEIDINCPIIFTTAYNQFWMQAFEGNGIEYLLKPFNQERFMSAWAKFKRLSWSNEEQSAILEKLQQVIGNQVLDRPTFKSRILVPNHKGAYFLSLDDVSFFLAENSLVWAVDQFSKKHLLKESTLRELEEQLSQEKFFRISRSHLVHNKYVLGLERYSKNSVAIKVQGENNLLVCSQSATPDFIKWMTES